MAITTLSAREFNQQVGRAKKCAKDGPVFITARGVQTHVLLDVEAYRRLARKPMSLAEMVGDASVADIELEIPPREMWPLREVDFD